MPAMRARWPVTEMAIVAAHAAVRSHLKNRVKKTFEDTLAMGPGKIGTPAIRARQAGGG